MFAGPAAPELPRARGAHRKLHLRLERLEVSGLARAGWRLWLSHDRAPLLLLLYRNHLKVEGVTSATVRSMIVLLLGI